MTKKEETLNLNLAESRKVNSLVCVNENFKTQSLIDVPASTKAFIISKKVNGIVKANTNSLKSTS